MNEFGTSSSIRQTYTLGEVATIIGVPEYSVARLERGAISRRIESLSRGRAIWSKAAIWRGLDLPLPAIRTVLHDHDVLTTRQVGDLVGISPSTVGEYCLSGRVPHRRSGAVYLIETIWLEQELRHPLSLWPSRGVDPAFGNFVLPTPSPADTTETSADPPASDDPMYLETMTVERFRALLREEILAALREVL